MSGYRGDGVFVTDGFLKTPVLAGGRVGPDHLATDDAMYFFSNDTLYQSDGTASGLRTVFVDKYHTTAYGGNRLFNSNSHSYLYHNGDLFFTADTSVYQYRAAMRQLRKVHSFPHQDLFSEIGEIYMNRPFGLTWFGGKLYVKALHRFRLELYEIDLLSGSVRMLQAPEKTYRSPFVRYIPQSPTLSDPSIIFNNRLYYTAGYDSAIAVALYMLEYPTEIAGAAASHSGFALSPNPTSGRVFLQLPAGNKLQQLVVRDAAGKTVFSQQFAPIPQTTIDLGKLPAGVYSVTALSDKGSASQQLVLTE